jgi:hypothetical protein
MEGLGGAASVIAVLDLSAKIAQWCIKYSLEVKDAKSDILRLHNEVKGLGKVVSDVQHLVTRADDADLSTLEKLQDAISVCHAQLQILEKTLDPGKARKAMSRFGVRAWRWPFQHKQVDKFIWELERCKGTLSLAL